MKSLFISLFAVGLVSSGAFASGFACEGEGFTVRLNNHVFGATRTPAALIVSHEDVSPRTLISKFGEQINKTNRKNTVQYSVSASSMDLKKAILQVSFKEGREVLEDGEVTDGQLILVAYDGSKEVVELDCSRRLKG